MPAAKKNVCIICNVFQGSYSTLHRHVEKAHQVSIARYYARLYFNSSIPVCACGCGEEVKFCQHTRTFNKFKHGHAIRVKNNWGHNKKALDNSHTMMRKLRQDGSRPAWNKGHTKEDDGRVREYGLAVSKTIRSNSAEIQKRSDKMRRGRLDGTIRTLYGSEHPKWKGGAANISAFVHSNSKIYDKWKRPKLKAAGWRCERCAETKDLHVHHNKETMSEILRKFIELYGYDAQISDESIKRKVIDSVIEYHVINKVSGIVLCHKCHAAEHPNMNFEKISRN